MDHDRAADRRLRRAALRERYRVERDHRSVATVRRYRAVDQGFSHLLADPYAAPVDRAPVHEETGYIPTERYSKAAEVRAHSQRIADHYELYPRSLFSTKVDALDWDERA